MKNNNINLILMLISAIIVVIISILSKYSLEQLAYTLLVVMVLFYILGSFLGVQFHKIVSRKESKVVSETMVATLPETEEVASKEE